MMRVNLFGNELTEISRNENVTLHSLIEIFLLHYSKQIRFVTSGKRIGEVKKRGKANSCIGKFVSVEYDRSGYEFQFI